MATDISNWPLLVLMDGISKWGRSAQGPHFWHEFPEHRIWAEQLRQEAKSIIVWLELRGREDAASELDAAMASFRRELWELKELSEGTYPPEDPRCRDHLEAVAEAAETVAGKAEDLDAELPRDVWEGFGGE